jgi:hypothetical protein
LPPSKVNWLFTSKVEQSTYQFPGGKSGSGAPGACEQTSVGTPARGNVAKPDGADEPLAYAASRLSMYEPVVAQSAQSSAVPPTPSRPSWRQL